MKILKVLGLAAVAAAALTAFLGAGTASATVLCEEEKTTGCAAAGRSYFVGATLHGTLEPGKSAVLQSTGGSFHDTCTESTIHGETTNSGGASETIRTHVETLTFGNCSIPTTVHQNENGAMEIAHIPGTDDGTVEATGFEITVNAGGVTCTYGAKAGSHLGKITGGIGATLDVEAVIPKVTGGFLCPTHAIWNAKYNVTAPVALYVSDN